jgi:hypothetical protein
MKKMYVEMSIETLEHSIFDFRFDLHVGSRWVKSRVAGKQGKTSGGRDKTLELGASSRAVGRGWAITADISQATRLTAGASAACIFES